MSGPSATASFEQGIASAKAGNLVLARMHLQQAIALDPENENIWLWLAWVAESPANATQCLDWVLKRSPDHPVARAGMLWTQTMAQFDAETQRLPDLEPERLALRHALGAESVSEPVTESIESDDPHEKVNEPESVPGSDEVVGTPRDSAPYDSEAASEEATASEPEIADESALDVEGAAEEQGSVEAEVAEHEQPSGERPTVRFERASLTARKAIQKPRRQWFDPSLSEGADDEDLEEIEEALQARHEEMSEPVESAPAALTEEPVDDVDDDRPLVMVVDDSPTVRKLVTMTLEEEDYRVITAFDGVAAINELTRVKPRLILMDINMPRLDGYKLCKLVKKHPNTTTIPVVMLSGKDGMFDKLRGRLVGCTDYITKPFDPDELKATVERYLGSPV